MQKYCFLTGTFCLGGVMPIEFQNGDEKSVNLPSQRGEKRINSLSYIEHFQRSWEGRETILFPYFDIHLVLYHLQFKIGYTDFVAALTPIPKRGTAARQFSL